MEVAFSDNRALGAGLISVGGILRRRQSMSCGEDALESGLPVGCRLAGNRRQTGLQEASEVLLLRGSQSRWSDFRRSL